MMLNKYFSFYIGEPHPTPTRLETKFKVKNGLRQSRALGKVAALDWLIPLSLIRIAMAKKFHPISVFRTGMAPTDTNCPQVFPLLWSESQVQSFDQLHYPSGLQPLVWRHGHALAPILLPRFNPDLPIISDWIQCISKEGGGMVKYYTVSHFALLEAYILYHKYNMSIIKFPIKNKQPKLAHPVNYGRPNNIIWHQNWPQIWEVFLFRCSADKGQLNGMGNTYRQITANS